MLKKKKQHHHEHHLFFVYPGLSFSLFCSIIHHWWRTRRKHFKSSVSLLSYCSFFLNNWNLYLNLLPAKHNNNLDALLHLLRVLLRVRTVLFIQCYLKSSWIESFQILIIPFYYGIIVSTVKCIGLRHCEWKFYNSVIEISIWDFSIILQFPLCKN